jgi:hypothetical protein
MKNNTSTPTAKVQIRKTHRSFKGKTLEVMSVRSNDCGLVFNGGANVWARQFGMIGSSEWIPMTSETHAVVNFRRCAFKAIRLRAAAKLRAA